MSAGYSVFASALHGCGVQADVHIAAGSVVLQEKPMHFLQTLPNRKSMIVCTTCLKPLGSLSLQMGILQGLVSRQNALQEYGTFGLLPGERACACLIPCTCNCGELYCSEVCRDHHWTVKGHKMLCTGLISDDEADMHPLINFKIHAMTTNEIFLMVADVFASMCAHVDSLVSSGADVSYAFEVAARPLAGYVREQWWDAAITPKGYKPVAFKKSLKTLVKDSWELLNDALHLTERGYAPYLSEEYLSRTIGMFEQNNVGVQMKSPLAEYVEALTSGAVVVDAATAAHILDSSERILDNIEDDGMCCDEDDEGEGGADEGDSGDEESEEEIEEGTAEDAATEGVMETDGTVSVSADPSIVALKELVDTHGIETLYPPLDGTAFYATICRINHSCDPNVRVTYVNSLQHGLQATLIALKPILPGEELVQSYIDQFQPLSVRQKALKDYGFQCTCSKCFAEANPVGISGTKA